LAKYLKDKGIMPNEASEHVEKLRKEYENMNKKWIQAQDESEKVNVSEEEN